MKLRNIIIAAVVVILVVGVGGFAALQFMAGTADPSQDISEVSSTVDSTSEDAVVFSIVSEESEASFALEEDLAGNRVTVVGTTNQVGGELAIDFDNPSASTVGEITINARNLQTDQNMRNQAIRSNILRSAQDQYEFITFMPTSLEGLPDSVEVGETITFDIVGDLTILDTTNQVTFAAEVTVVSETEITGSADVTIIYADWGVNIPFTPPQVANVEDEADLSISFVARAAE